MTVLVALHAPLGIKVVWPREVSVGCDGEEMLSSGPLKLNVCVPLEVSIGIGGVAVQNVVGI